MLQSFHLKKRFLFLALLLFLLTSCGGDSGSSQTQPTATVQPTPLAPTPTPTVVQPPEGYLNADETGVRFIKWVEANGQINGSLSAVSLVNGVVRTISGPVTGTRSGENISLTMDVGPVKIPATGTLKDNVLTLQTPGPGGEMKEAVYKGASTAEYEQALDAFKAKHGAT